MKNILLIVLVVLFVSCKQEAKESTTAESSEKEARVDTLPIITDTIVPQPITKKEEPPPCECHLKALLKLSDVPIPYYDDSFSEPVGSVDFGATTDTETQCGFRLIVVASKDGYFKISNNIGELRELLYDSTRVNIVSALAGHWVKSEHLFSNFDDAMYVDETDYWIFTAPHIDSTKVKKLDYTQYHTDIKYERILGCCKEWFYAEITFKDGPVEGWIPWYHWCENTCTNCARTPIEGFPIYGN
jgi:hypothetical protein